MELINQERELQDICVGLTSEVLCLDTEFVRRSTFYPILALVQIADKDKEWLIDAPQIQGWQPLVQQLQSRKVVMHSASEDLEVFRNSLNSLPRSLFDTQVAAAFVGLGSALSYAALVETLLGVVLEKSQTQSDWLRRPLSDAQKKYACEDVIYLEEIYEILSAKLEEQGKMSWMTAYAEQTLISAAAQVEPDKAYLKIKGAGNLSAEHLGLLASLASWRERRARELDRPRNWLIRDAEMAKAVRFRPQSLADLDNRVGMSSESIRRYGQEILKLIADPPEVEITELPPANLESNDRSLVKKLQEKVSQLASQHQVAERLIANRSDLEDLIRYQRGMSPTARMLNDWRSEVLTPQILELVDAG